MNRLHVRVMVAIAMVIGVLSACDWHPKSRDSAAAAKGGGGAATTALQLTFDPPMDPAAVDPIVHLRLETGARADLDAKTWLFSGELTTADLAAINRGAPTKKVLAREVPTHARVDGSALIIAPDIALPTGEVTLVAGGSPMTFSFNVVASTVPRLARAWPPNDASASPSAWLFCGGSALPWGAADGDFSTWIDPRCVRYVGLGDAGVDEAIPPARLDLGGVDYALEPGALAHTDRKVVSPRACDAGSDTALPFGLGCARVEDDRLVVHSFDGPAYWSVRREASDTDSELFSGPVSASARFVVRGLEPAAANKLTLTVIDENGENHADSVLLTTLAAAPHVVISEVYANPVGPEPLEEWVELFNDGLEPASLDGATLEDGKSSTPLPAVVVPPGGYALVVGKGFVASDGFDPPVPETCPQIVVDAVGKSGLSNQGVALLIRDASGRVLSRAFAGASPSGTSYARVSIDAADDQPFARAVPTPCAPNLLDGAED